MRRFHTPGEQRVIADPRMIAFHHAGTCLAFDLGIVCADWSIFAFATLGVWAFMPASRTIWLSRGVHPRRMLRLMIVRA